MIHFTVGRVAVRPRQAGKIATVLQMAVVMLILLKWDAAGGGVWMKWLALGAAGLTGISGLLYTWDGMQQLGAHPASSPTPPGNGGNGPPP